MPTLPPMSSTDRTRPAPSRSGEALGGRLVLAPLEQLEQRLEVAPVQQGDRHPGLGDRVRRHPGPAELVPHQAHGVVDPARDQQEAEREQGREVPAHGGLEQERPQHGQRGDPAQDVHHEPNLTALVPICPSLEDKGGGHRAQQPPSPLQTTSAIVASRSSTGRYCTTRSRPRPRSPPARPPTTARRAISTTRPRRTGGTAAR